MAISIKQAIETGTGSGVKIGILDTGVTALPSLNGSLKGHYQVVDKDRQISIKQNRSGFDDINHGTVCANLIHRYAPDADLYDIKVMDYKAENSRYKIGAGIRFGTELGLDILNVCVGTKIDYTRLQEVTQDAVDAGIIVISAIDCDADTVGFPAAYPDVVSVDYDQLNGPLDFKFTPHADICGHGVYVESLNADGQIEAFTGSSFACPHITALAARIRQFFPKMGGVDLMHALKVQASPLPC